ncbi:MAG: nitrilase family protein [Deltaproteobacteria bacterium]|nr:nitrilase family protein [Deltaproteobacteria bacterium]MBW1957549.1 nitrilase family protein [Deltaproteobacteria bacterium]MBW2319436.1 nitrilase family protein [Deltaproteobacteria bacterium]
MKDVRIAVVVSNSPANKISNNLEGMVKWIKSSKNQGAAIVCFPEMNISGYSNHQDINLAAEPIPGPASRYLLNLARCEKIVILAGIVERDEKNRLFASHLVIKPDGFVGVYRKLHISPPERNVLTPGDKIPLFHAGGVNFGIQLCYDAHFPELSTRMALKGADLIFIPHASPRGTPEEKYRSWMRHLPARAFDNSLFIIACNQTGENEKGLSFPGIALIIGPSGEVIHKDLSGKEGLLLANLKAEDLNRVRSHRMRYFIPNRRPELYYTQKISEQSSQQ